MLVLLSDVVLFTEVDEVDYGLCGEEEEGVYYFNLYNRKHSAPYVPLENQWSWLRSFEELGLDSSRSSCSSVNQRELGKIR